jgi:hypothetical protein
LFFHLIVPLHHHHDRWHLLRFTMCAGVASEALMKKACRGAYSWNGSAVCGMPGVTACENPATYVSWDGVHYTETVNRYVAKGWLYGPYADPPVLGATRF